MKKTIIIVIIAISAFAVTYGSIAFVTMKPNPSDWTGVLRAAFLAYSIIITGVCLWIFLQEYEENK